MNIHERVAQKREAGHVERWHLVPHIGHQDVAAHSWQATMLLLELYPKASRRLIVYMLNHDVTERWIGDIPANAKGLFPGIATGVADAEKELVEKRSLEDAGKLNSAERCWVRAIDALELVLWCREQHAMGNIMTDNAMHEVEHWIMTEECVPGPVRAFLENYKWKRYPDYLWGEKHYGNNE